MKHIQALQAYEGQVSSLARAMSRLEEDLHKAHEEKTALLSDLASVRELCVKLDSGKELTARQLTVRSMDVERVRPQHAPAPFPSCPSPLKQARTPSRSLQSWRTCTRRQSC